jgi:hypothetical protein
VINICCLILYESQNFIRDGFLSVAIKNERKLELSYCPTISLEKLRKFVLEFYCDGENGKTCHIMCNIQLHNIHVALGILEQSRGRLP